MGSNMHLCLEFYVNIVRYIVVIFYGPLQIAGSIYVMKLIIKPIFIKKIRISDQRFYKTA